MLKPFLAALGFLSIAPLPGGLAGGEKELSSCLKFFPLVGLLMGVLFAALDRMLIACFPPLLASALLMVAMLMVSGGLHLDGLADTADGYFSARSRERMLEIMRDSRTGPMGVIAVLCVLLVKVAALASLPLGWRAATVALMPLAGRCALVLNLVLLPYARPSGLATIFHRQRTWSQAMWAGAVVCLAGWLALSWIGLGAAVASVLAACLFAVYSWRKIGGLTGDTLGAACELTEIIPALFVVAVTHGRMLG